MFPLPLVRAFRKSVAWHLMSPEPDTLAETRFACRPDDKQVARTRYTVIGFLGSSRQYCRARSCHGCFGAGGRYVVKLQISGTGYGCREIGASDVAAFYGRLTLSRIR